LFDNLTTISANTDKVITMIIIFLMTIIILNYLSLLND